MDHSQCHGYGTDVVSEGPKVFEMVTFNSGTWKRGYIDLIFSGASNLYKALNSFTDSILYS